VESLGMVYQCHYPNKAMHTARDAKRSPLHDRLAAQGAYFKDVSGWESPSWYAGAGATPDPGSLTFGRPSWWGNWEAEHRACRDGVVLIDMSFMSKFRVQGSDAGRVLDHLSTNAVDGDSGTITYTQWLNPQGTLEADLTVTRRADDDFLVVATDTAHRHVEMLLQRHIGDAHAFVTDVTGALAQINVQGPRAREVMQAVTDADMTNEAFPFRAAREIAIGFARVLCVRITYVGELGYELFVPTEQAVHVYDRLVEAGEEFGLEHAGLSALGSLRMEKAYRDYGHDIDNTDTPLEAGFGFSTLLDKPGGFVGRDAVVAAKASGAPSRRLVQVLVLDPEPLMYHAEVIRRDGDEVGYIRAASYGHTLGGAVGLAMVERSDGPVTTQWLAAGEWTVEIVDRRYPCTVSLRPLYDPANERIRA
jgi:4-methylaminobutanoate oxidase (formaldehyde-forming)